MAVRALLFGLKYQWSLISTFVNELSKMSAAVLSDFNDGDGDS